MTELDVPSLEKQSRQLASVSSTFTGSQEQEYIELAFESNQNPEMAKFENASNKSLVKENSSKILLKQKDRFENNSIEKGMFHTMEESKDELQIIFNNASSAQLKSSESIESISKRPSMKLIPLENLMRTKSEKLFDQEHFNKVASKSKKSGMSNIKAREIMNKNKFCKDLIGKNKVLAGTLKRNIYGSERFSPRYDLYLNDELTYLMNSKKKTWRLNSTFMMGTKIDPVEEADSDYIGTLKSNFVGSEWSIYDTLEDGETEIIATIAYTNEVTCSFSPRQIEVYVLCSCYKYSDLEGSDERKSKNLKELYGEGENRKQNRIIKLITKKPTWNPEKSQWVMDFHGKALQSSIKNMILIEAENENNEVMILAKAGNNEFNIDIKYPLSPRIAVAVASTSFDFKLVSQ